MQQKNMTYIQYTYIYIFLIYIYIYVYNVVILPHAFILGLFLNSLSVVVFSSAKALRQSGEPKLETMPGL